jgi:molybdate transport system substrate-binding protein
MRSKRYPGAWHLAVLLLLNSHVVSADTLEVAVASNFRPTMSRLVPAFEVASGHDLSVSYGSTGGHYAQILSGAPYDVFLAADSERPARLESGGIAVKGSRVTYALGRLVLWGPGVALNSIGTDVLTSKDFRFLAVANPRTAPYGLAAEQVLRGLGLWDSLQARIVRGENVGQAYAFVASGNAEMGFVAESQMITGETPRDEFWLVPQDQYEPIEQQAVLIKESEAGRSLLSFLRSDEAAEIIVSTGYGLP